MNWKIKAFIQKTIDLFPFRNYINYFLQKNITKKLPVPKWMFEEMVKEANHHFSKLVEYQQCFKNLSEVKHYEFGSGWDMIVPLTYYRFGITSQHLIDLHYLLKIDLIENTLIRLNQVDDSQLDYSFLQKLEGINSVDLNAFGIHYNAPQDARNTLYETNFFHFASSTNVLEHVPKSDILAILNETYRILKPGGIFTFRIDYSDHYSYFDSSISIYNFLQFSDDEWRKFDHSLQPQTRIRHSEMLNFIFQTKFELVNEKIHQPSEFEIGQFEKIKLASQFNSFEQQDLLVGWAYITLRKLL